MERVPDILQAISQERIAEMQARLALVWRRWGWQGGTA